MTAPEAPLSEDTVYFLPKGKDKGVDSEGTYSDVKHPQALPPATQSPAPQPQKTTTQKVSTASTQNTPTEKEVSKETPKSTEASAARSTATGKPKSTDQPTAQKPQLTDEAHNAKMLNTLPIMNNPLYNVNKVLDKLKEYPILNIRREGRFYVSTKNTIVEKHQKLLFNKRGQVIPVIHKEKLGTIENIFTRFCEDVLCISRSLTLPLTSQGERHLIWVGRIKAKHILKFLKGNGCYVLNRFPGDVFLKDKQVMGVTLRQYMLERQNRCFWQCGVDKDPYKLDFDDNEEPQRVTWKICAHMVRSMRTDSEGCTNDDCYNNGKSVCKHFDVFIPEVQSFSSYNALQDFSNRLRSDLKGQVFLCKPAYLYKGLGFRVFRTSPEFEEFYHMTVGKDTSRHDFLVQRVVHKPYLFNQRKVDIRSFMLILTLRHRRVLAFLNPGFCRVAATEYGSDNDSEEDAAEPEDPEGSDPKVLTPKQERLKQTKKLINDMKRIVCTYQTDEERADRIKRMKENRQFSEAEDRSKELDEVFRSHSLLAKIKKQIKHIANCLANGIEKRIWDAYGCYQIFGLDFCVDENHKVWLLEVNSHAMSDVDLLSPTQRIVVPAAIIEALGLVVECMYKSTHSLRLRKSPYDEFKETGFLFAQNYEMVFSTLKRKRTDFVPPRPKHDDGPPFYERITVVDEMIRKTNRRKAAYDAMTKQIIEEKAQLKKKQSEKAEEES